MDKIIALFIAISLVGCGAGDSKKEMHGASKGINGIGVTSSNELASKVNFLCKEDECPDSYALVIGSKSKNDYFRCTGFFISKNRLATNAHCLNQVVGNCQSSIVIKTLSGQVAKCSKILYKTDSKSHSNYKLDFAVIELDREVDITPAKLSSKGFKRNQYYSYWKTEKEFSNDSQTIPSDDIYLKKMKYCKVTYNNVRLPQANDPNGTTAVFKNCPVKPGNEGAPIVNMNNEVVGLVWGKMDSTRDFNFFMSPSTGKSLMLANSLICIAAKRGDLFPGIKVTAAQRDKCRLVYNESTLARFLSLTKIFYPKYKERKTRKIVTAFRSSHYKNYFYSIKHDACYKKGRPFLARACSFFPRLSYTYELRSSRLYSCSDSRDLEFKFIEDGLLSGLQVYDILGKKVARFYIDKCRD